MPTTKSITLNEVPISIKKKSALFLFVVAVVRLHLCLPNKEPDCGGMDFLKDTIYCKPSLYSDLNGSFC